MIVPCKLFLECWNGRSARMPETEVDLGLRVVSAQLFQRCSRQLKSFLPFWVSAAESKMMMMTQQLYNTAVP